MTEEERRIAGLRLPFTRADLIWLCLGLVWALYLLLQVNRTSWHIPFTNLRYGIAGALLFLIVSAVSVRMSAIAGKRRQFTGGTVHVLTCRPDEVLAVTVLNDLGYETKRYYIFRVEHDTLLAIDRDDCDRVYGGELPNTQFALVQDKGKKLLAIHAIGEILRPTRSVMIQDVAWQPPCLNTPYTGTLEQYHNKYRSVA